MAGEASAGSAVFRAIADFAALRRESKAAAQGLKDLGNESDKAGGKLGANEQKANKSGNAFSRAGDQANKFAATLKKFRNSDAGRAIDDVGKAAGRMGKSLASIGSKVFGFALISTAAVGAVGPVMQLVGAIASLSGVAGLIPAALGAGAAAIGVIALGLSGLKEAFAPVSGAVSGLANAQKQADRASITGAENVRAARQRLADAQTAGAKRVEQAERNLARAQVAAKDAQVDLNRAREDAVERLQDLKLELSGAALDEKGANLGLLRAQERLSEVIRERGSGLDIAEAQHGVDLAKQAIAEAADRYSDLRKESEAANKAGVDGADNVVSAQRRVADTMQDVSDAQGELASSRVDAARDVADAERDLAIAIRDAAWAQQDAAASIASAAGKALPKLADSAKDFVAAVKSLAPAWEALRLNVQEKLFAGLGDRVRDLGGKYMPMLKTESGKLATTFNGMAHEFADWLAQKSTVDDMSSSLQNINKFWANLKSAIKPLSQAFMDIFAVGAELLPGMGTSLADLAKKFADFIREARESGRLKEWMQNGIEALKDLGATLVNIGRIFGSIFKAGKAEGAGFLQTLREATDALADFLESAEGQESLRKMFAAIKDAAKAIGPILKTAFSVFADIVPILTDIVERLAPGVKAFIEGIGKAFEVARPGLDKLSEALGGLLEAIGNAGPFIGAVFNGLSNVLSPIVDALSFIIKTVTDLFNALPKPAQDAIGQLGGLVVAAGLAVFAIKKLMDIGGKLVKTFGAVSTAVGKVTDKLGGSGDDTFLAGGGKDKKNTKGGTAAAGGAKTKGKGFGLIGGLVGVASAATAFDMGATAMEEFESGAVSKSEATRDAIGAGLMGGAGVAAMFGPWGLVVAAALAAGSFIVSNWDSVASFFSTIGGWIADRAVDIWNGITGALSGASSWATDWWVPLWTNVGQFFSDIGSWIGNTASDVWNWVTTTLGQFGNWIATNWNAFWNSAGQIVSDIGSWIGTTATDIWNGVTGTLSNIGSWISSTWHDIWEGAKSTVSEAASAIGTFVSDMVRKIGDLLDDLANARRLARDLQNSPDSSTLDKLTGIGGLSGALGFSKGGTVPGSGNTDSVDAKLMPGEYVWPKEVMREWGWLARALNPYDTGGSELAAQALSMGDLMTNAAGAAGAMAGSMASRVVAATSTRVRGSDDATSGPTIGSMSVTQIVQNPLPEKPSETATKRMGRAAAFGTTMAIKGVA